MHDFNRAIELDPQDHLPVGNRAGLWLARRDYARALADSERVIQLAPEEAQGYHLRGLTLLRTGETDRALADLDRAVQLAPTTVHLNSRGVAWASKGELNKAIGDFNAALKLDSHAIAALLNRGEALLTQGKTDRALEDFSRVLRLDPNSGEAYLNRGLTFRSMGNFDAAVADFGEAIQLEAGTKAYRCRGELLVHLAQLNEANADKYLVQAIKDLNEALRADDSFALAYVNRAIAQLMRGDSGQSQQDLEAALKLEPEKAKGAAPALANAGLTLWNRGQYKEALMLYEAAIFLDPECSDAYTLRGKSLAVSEDPAFRDMIRAIADATKACELTDWHDYDSLWNLVSVYYLSGDLDSAIKWQERVVELAPPETKQSHIDNLETFKLLREERQEAKPDTAVAEQVERQQEIPVSDKTLLRWRFTPGDSIRLNSRSTEAILNGQVENMDELVCDYRWLVESVDKERAATIRVIIDRVRFRDDHLPLRYDSQSEDPTVEVAYGTETKALVYQLRALSNVEFQVVVNPRGGVIQTAGTECVIAPRAYTPGDWPALPEEPVQVGDSWSVKLENEESTISPDSANYAVLKCVPKGDHSIWHIKGESRNRDADLGDRAVSIVSLSQFDAENGAFVSEELETRIPVQFQPGEHSTIVLKSTRQIVRHEREVVSETNTGEFAFAVENGKPQPLIVAGEPVQGPHQPQRTLLLQFYHEWSDDDENEAPAPGELKDLTTRFAAGTPVNFAIFASQLENEALSVTVLDAGGQKVLEGELPIKGESAWIRRSLPNLDPGIYFFKFSMNDEHLVRVPVQVYTPLEPLDNGE